MDIIKLIIEKDNECEYEFDVGYTLQKPGTPYPQKIILTKLEEFLE